MIPRSDAAARAAMETARWPHGPVCDRCGSGDVVPVPTHPGFYRCRACERQFSVTSGTPMHGTRLPLRTWLRTGALILSEDVNALELSRRLGLGYRTAWSLARRVRTMIASGEHPFNAS